MTKPHGKPQVPLASMLLSAAQRDSLEAYLLHEPLVLGVSGGADSLAMLHLLCALRGERAQSSLHVAHLNHWFRDKEGKEDAEFVREAALARGLTYTAETFDVPNYARRYKLSDEDAARKVRYGFLARLAQERDAAVAVAHNADDQVETVLMSILRGTGTGGLAGMQMLSVVPFYEAGEGLSAIVPSDKSSGVALYRPLLKVWRHQIVNYCKEEGLEPRFDATNWERTYRRNRVRHDLIPLLQMQYSLAIKDHLFNLAQITHAEDELLESIVEEEWHRTARWTPGREAIFDVVDFAALALAMRRRLARRAIQEVAGTVQDITFAHVEAAIAILANGADSPRAMHLPHGLEVSRQGQQSRIGRQEDHEAIGSVDVGHRNLWPSSAKGSCVAIQPGEALPLKNGWRLESRLGGVDVLISGRGDLSAQFDYDAILEGGSLELRTRREGDFIQPLGMDGHKSLQDLMVDAKIPRELRGEIALVAFADKGEVLWVPGTGGRRSDRGAVGEQTQHILQIRFVRE